MHKHLRGVEMAEIESELLRPKGRSEPPEKSIKKSMNKSELRQNLCLRVLLVVTALSWLSFAFIFI